jgi:hypothetical protein
MYGISHDGQLFEVFARRESADDGHLVIRFECKDGMGVLGIRKIGRTDPAPSTVYQEADIDAESLRAGRFVHVMGSGQRQSYALSRLSPEIAARLPFDAWVELQPHTEYGFRYLVAPEERLLSAPATPAPAVVAGGPAQAVVTPPAAAPSQPATTRVSASDAPRAPVSVASTDVPSPVPMAPALAQAALARLDRDTAIRHLVEEMNKVASLQHEVTRLEEELMRSSSRERDLIGLLSKWRER